jgi:hypothetical protein
MDKQYHEDLTRSIEALCSCLSSRCASAYRCLMLLVISGTAVALVVLGLALGAILLAVLIG